MQYVRIFWKAGHVHEALLWIPWSTSQAYEMP